MKWLQVQQLCIVTDTSAWEQGDHSSWKVMEFSKTIFQAWKVMENSQGHEKSWKFMEKDDDVLEFFVQMH